jgi:hypothetical protein
MNWQVNKNIMPQTKNIENYYFEQKKTPHYLHNEVNLYL